LWPCEVTQVHIKRQPVAAGRYVVLQVQTIRRRELHSGPNRVRSCLGISRKREAQDETQPQKDTRYAHDEKRTAEK
ncbi:MAG TPA: hypothetical protein DCE41_03595, partial [Cytophagales bacterium]|nr:hypothetical protein [Cytophagales bacterium]